MAGEVIEARNDYSKCEVKTEPEKSEGRNVLRLIRNGKSWRIARDKENHEFLPTNVDLREAKSWFQHSTYSSIDDQNVSSILPSGGYHRGSDGFESYETEFSCPDDPGLFALVECSITLPIKSESRSKNVNPKKDTRKFNCEKCLKQYIGLKGFNRHKETHRTTRPYKCPICSKGFKLKENMRGHEKLHYGFKRKNIKCEVCGKDFINLQRHALTHTDLRPYECNLCGRGFKREFDLQTHATVHSEEKPFPCLQCDRKFKYRRALLKHEQISHSLLRAIMETLPNLKKCRKKGKGRGKTKFLADNDSIAIESNCHITRSSINNNVLVKPCKIEISTCLDTLSKNCYVKLERLSAETLATFGIQTFSWAMRVSDIKTEII